MDNLPKLAGGSGGKLPDFSKDIEFAKGVLDKAMEGAECFMISFHVIKKRRIDHYFNYESFPLNDWGACMIAMGKEAGKAELRTKTGKVHAPIQNP